MSYECPRCRGEPGVRPIDGRPFKEVDVGDCVLEAVDRFCYLGDMLSAGGGSMAAPTARCRCAWGKLRENLPLLTSKPVPFDLRGRLFSSNVRSSMLHGTETWPMTSDALHQLCRNDCAMIRWICGVKPSDDPSMEDLHAKLGICDLAILVWEHQLRWFGHVMRSNGEINRVRSRPVAGRKGPGRPKKIWDECVKQDLKVCGLSEAGTQDRVSWRSSLKNSRQEPTPSNGSAPQSTAVPPARQILGMRTRSLNKTGFDWLIDWLMFAVPCNNACLGGTLAMASSACLNFVLMMLRASMYSAYTCFAAVGPSGPILKSHEPRWTATTGTVDGSSVHSSTLDATSLSFVLPLELTELLVACVHLLKPILLCLKLLSRELFPAFL